MAVYATPFWWIWADPIKSREDVHYTLDPLFKKVGVPKVFIPDNAKELTQGRFRKKALRAGAAIHPIEAYTPNANMAEGGIRELKRAHRRSMAAKNTPECCWDRSMRYHSLTRSYTALDLHQLGGKVPMTLLTGNTADISFIAELGWFEWCWYITQETTSLEVKKLGRYCRPSFDIGDALTAAILTEKGVYINTTSYWGLSVEELNDEEIRGKMDAYTTKLDESLKKRGKDGKVYPVLEENSELTPDPEPYEPAMPHDEKPVELAEADDIDHEAFDKYISARVCIPQGDEMHYGTVRRRKRDADGELVGKSTNNPFTDTALYEVEFNSGDVEEYTANIIAENIYAQVDDEGYTYYSIDEILDHTFDSTALFRDDAYTLNRGKCVLKRTTKGWKICVRWKDGTTSWVSLRDLKESNPVELAEYAVAN